MGRRAHHPAMQHPGHPDVLHKGEGAEHFVRNVPAFNRSSDDRVILRRFRFCLTCDLYVEFFTRDEFGVSDLFIRCPAHDRDTISGDDLLACYLEPFGREIDERRTRFGGRLANGT